MYVVYWERSLHKSFHNTSWPTISERTTKIVGVVKGGMNEIISYMDSIVEDNIKAEVNEWYICYTNANVDPKKITFTILRHSNNNKNSMMIRYIAVEARYLN